MIYQVFFVGLLASSYAAPVMIEESPKREQAEVSDIGNSLKSVTSAIKNEVDSKEQEIMKNAPEIEKNARLSNLVRSVLGKIKTKVEDLEASIMENINDISNIKFETKSNVDEYIYEYIEELKEDEENLENYIKSVEPKTSLKSDIFNEINRFTFNKIDYVEHVASDLLDSVQAKLTHILQKVKSEVVGKKDNMLGLVERIKKDPENYIKEKIVAYREEINGEGSDIESKIAAREQELQNAVGKIVTKSRILADEGIMFGGDLYSLKTPDVVTRVEENISTLRKTLDDILNNEEELVYDELGRGDNLKHDIQMAEESKLISHNTLSALEQRISSRKMALSILPQVLDKEIREYLQKAIEGEIRSYETFVVSLEKLLKDVDDKILKLTNRLKGDESWLRNLATQLIENLTKEAENKKNTLKENVYDEIRQSSATVQTEIKNIMENREDYISNKVEEFKREIEAVGEGVYTTDQIEQLVVSKREELSRLVEKVISDPQAFMKQALSAVQESSEAAIVNLERQFQIIDNEVSLGTDEIHNKVKAMQENPEEYLNHILDEHSVSEDREPQSHSHEETSHEHDQHFN